MQSLISRFGGTPALILKLVFLGAINAAAIWALPALLTSGAWVMLAVLLLAVIALDFVMLTKKFIPAKYVIFGAIFLTVWGGVAGSTPFAIEILASALAFSVAVVNNFFLNRHWTFRSKGPIHIQFGKFFTVSLAGLGLNTLAFALFRGQAGLDVLLSQLLAILIVLPFNYLGSKLWSFR